MCDTLATSNTKYASTIQPIGVKEYALIPIDTTMHLPLAFTNNIDIETGRRLLFFGDTQRSRDVLRIFSTWYYPVALDEAGLYKIVL